MMLSYGAPGGWPRMPSPKTSRSRLSRSGASSSRALSCSGLQPLDRDDPLAELRQQRRLVAAAGADLEHGAEVAGCARAAPPNSSSIMRATTDGFEIVWPWPIGRLVSS